MKSYSVNSPEAAARVLAMAMLADSEVELLDALSAAWRRPVLV
jgi:hypothetical protein